MLDKIFNCLEEVERPETINSRKLRLQKKSFGKENGIQDSSPEGICQLGRQESRIIFRQYYWVIFMSSIFKFNK